MNILKNLTMKKDWWKLLLALILIHYIYTITGNSVLDPKPLAEYRLVYKNAVHGYDGWHNGCGEERTGWFYYVEVKEEGWFEDFEFTGKCAYNVASGKDVAEEILTKRLESINSENRIYQAFITKEDTVKFSYKMEE